MTVHFPQFRQSISDQMAAYRERLADRISKELQKRGEDHRDLAHALRTDPRTAERWTTGETEPQRRYRKPLADYFGVEMEDFWPDLELEDKAFKQWMERLRSGQDHVEAELAAVRVEISAMATQLEEMRQLLSRRLETASSRTRTRKAK